MMPVEVVRELLLQTVDTPMVTTERPAPTNARFRELCQRLFPELFEHGDRPSFLALAGSIARLGVEVSTVTLAAWWNDQTGSERTSTARLKVFNALEARNEELTQKPSNKESARASAGVDAFQLLSLMTRTRHFTDTQLNQIVAKHSNSDLFRLLILAFDEAFSSNA